MERSCNLLYSFTIYHEDNIDSQLQKTNQVLCNTTLTRGDFYTHSLLRYFKNITELQQILKYP